MHNPTLWKMYFKKHDGISKAEADNPIRKRCFWTFAAPTAVILLSNFSFNVRDSVQHERKTLGYLAIIKSLVGYITYLHIYNIKWRDVRHSIFKSFRNDSLDDFGIFCRFNDCILCVLIYTHSTTGAGFIAKSTTRDRLIWSPKHSTIPFCLFS
jgi:hypothetical protein